MFEYKYNYMCNFIYLFLYIKVYLYMIHESIPIIRIKICSKVQIATKAMVSMFLEHFHKVN